MKYMHHRYVHLREHHEGIEAVSLMISLVVAVMVIAIIWMILPDPVIIKEVTTDVQTISNAEYDGSVIWQLGEGTAKVRVNVTVLDTKNNGVVDASVEITGPGFSKKTNTTNNYGVTQFTVSFTLPSRAGDYLTIKASGGKSGLGGEVKTQVPINFKGT